MRTEPRLRGLCRVQPALDKISAAESGRSQFSCKPKAIANLFDIAEVRPKMGAAKDSDRFFGGGTWGAIMVRQFSVKSQYTHYS